mgnify:CR=1 FL=1
MAESGQTLFVTGYARLPAGITASEISRVVGIAFEVDAQTGEIVDADCTLATALGKRFFRDLVVGYNLDQDLKMIINQIEKRYHGNAQRSLVAALKIAHEKYQAGRMKVKG